MNNNRTSRSEHRIPRLRTRGRENRRRLLAEAERMLHESDGSPLKFSDVFEAAGVSRGSAYRIYIGIDDLLQDLATEWLNNFVDFLSETQFETPPRHWADLAGYIVDRGAEYWAQTADTMRVLPLIRSSAPSSYNDAVREMANCIAQIFESFFVIPSIEGWHGKMAFVTQLLDTAFGDAVRSEGHIGAQRRKEAKALVTTYLAFYLPDHLPPRDGAA